MRRIFLALLGASALAVALGAGGLTRPSPPEPSVSLAADGPALRTEVAAVRRDLERVKVKVARSEVVAAPASDGSKPEAPAQPEPDPESARTEAGERVRHVAEVLERRYATESIDRSWSEKQSAEIRAEIGNRIPGTTASLAGCASSLCKVVLRHDTTESQMALARELAELPAMGAGVFYDYHTDTVPLETVLYVLRAGLDPATL